MPVTSDSKPQEGGDVVNMVQLCNIERYIKVCNCPGFNTVPVIYSIGKGLTRRRRDRPDLILPGDLRTREQQVLRLVVWGLII